jgi:hypothetical protein
MVILLWSIEGFATELLESLVGRVVGEGDEFLLFRGLFKLKWPPLYPILVGKGYMFLLDQLTAVLRGQLGTEQKRRDLIPAGCGESMSEIGGLLCAALGSVRGRIRVRGVAGFESWDWQKSRPGGGRMRGFGPAEFETWIGQNPGLGDSDFA